MLFYIIIYFKHSDLVGFKSKYFNQIYLDYFINLHPIKPTNLIRIKKALFVKIMPFYVLLKPFYNSIKAPLLQSNQTPITEY